MTSAVRSFYGRWARLYDLLARYTPGVSEWRDLAVHSLALSPGDTVIDIGCGTGATLGRLRDAVSPGGRVVGVDLTPGVLRVAARRSAEWPAVSLVSGDAMDPPLNGPIDAILGSFVVGLLENPAAAVDRWRSIVGPTGRVALLDARPTGWAPPLDWLFSQFVRAGAPPSGRTGAADRLTRRVQAAHERLRIEGSDPTVRQRALDLVKVTAANGCRPADSSPLRG